jgi:flagellar protein FliL
MALALAGIAFERGRSKRNMSDDKDKDTKEPEKAKGGGKLLPIMLVMNTALIGGVLFFVMKKPAPAAAGPAKEGAAETAAGDGHGAPAAAGNEKDGEHAAPAGKKGAYTPPGPILKLENFVIQLKTVDADRYVRLAFDIEVATEADKQAVQDHLSHIRDLVISYFADRTLDELRGSEAMERTKATLIKRIDDLVPGRRVKNLFITDFIVQ